MVVSPETVGESVMKNSLGKKVVEGIEDIGTGEDGERGRVNSEGRKNSVYLCLPSPKDLFE